MTKAYAQAGYRVFASVRKQADADRLAKELGERVVPVIFDVTDQAAVEAGAAQVKAALNGEGLSFLINNAGIATAGPMHLQPLEEIQWQFEVNVISQIRVTQAFLPMLGAVKNPGFKPGRILMISSVGGKIAAPFMGAYAGSKHALEGMSEAMRRELQLYNIDVIIIGPGAIKTPIWDKPSATDMSALEGTDYENAARKFQAYMLKTGREGLDADYLAQRILKLSEKKKPKARYTFAPKKFREWSIPRMLPVRVVDRAIRKSLGLSPEGGGKDSQGGRYI